MARNDQEFSNRILIVEVSGPGKTNSLLHRRNHQSDIDKIYMLKIHMKRNINYYLTKEKEMILTLLLNTRMILIEKYWRIQS